MANIVAEFFNIIGVDTAPPETMAELIPYLLTVLVGVVLVLAVFKFVATITGVLMSANRRI